MPKTPSTPAATGRRRYRKKSDQLVVAVQLNLDTEPFTYEKWGGTQTCKPGDWIVNNSGETYTVDRDEFARTYRQVSPGVYQKATSVWAEVASEPGVVQTKEGTTAYAAGDYLVWNDEAGTDKYAVSQARFTSMYELDE